MLNDLTHQLKAGQSLTEEQVRNAVEELVEEAVSPEGKADFLVALAAKGETNEEIGAFAHAVREKSVQPPLPDKVRDELVLIDVCGTGGDQLGTFNISTTVALLLAAAEICVAKHGNRAITSSSGSADVLESLGIRIDRDPQEAVDVLVEHHFAFFFAPNFHPAFKNIAPARKLCAERGRRTIFNFLGPLLNPVRPNAQLIGVPRSELCEPMARVLQTLGVRRGMVVTGEVPEMAGAETAASQGKYNLDELSIFGQNTIAEFYHGRGFNVSEMMPDQFPLQPASLNDLAGGNRDENATVVVQLLSGEEKGPKRDAVLLNAAAALLVADRVKSLMDGWDLAAELIDSGQAIQKLKQLQSL